MKQTGHIKTPAASGTVKLRPSTQEMAVAAIKPPKTILPLKTKSVVAQGAKKLNFDFPEDEPRSSIQWPNDDQIGTVCSRLRQVKKIGMENECLGDHFSSGDLAYQVHEIIRSTEELFRKSLRVKKNAA